MLYNFLKFCFSILADTEKWFVINKPSSIPVHACGQYRIHSAIGLLRTMDNITGLKGCSIKN